MIGRIGAFFYGIVCYLFSLVTFLYLFCFLGNFGVSRSIDSGSQVPLLQALAINTLLVALFGLQHSVMARPGFKAVWTRIVPSSVERSTYLLFSCAALFVLFWKWQPMGGVIWSLGSNSGRLALNGMYVIGWLTVLLTTFVINHFDLFGLRQVWLKLLGRNYTEIGFRTPGPYRFVRHPIYVGWLLVFWSAPVMTAAHLLCAIAISAYILIAIQFEERDLIQFHGEYSEYRRRVPMLVPNGSSMQPERAEMRRVRASQAG
jgi:protein-S-isoprenylcysteine O-methyltransferase Ste14